MSLCLRRTNERPVCPGRVTLARERFNIGGDVIRGVSQFEALRQRLRLVWSAAEKAATTATAIAAAAAAAAATGAATE